MSWIWEGRESCPTLLGRAELSPYLGDHLGSRGPQDITPICSSSWNDCFHSLSYPPLQMNIWVAQNWNALHSQCLLRWALPSFRLSLNFLERVLAFSFFFFLSSCDSICLRVSIDSCYARIISSCSLWTRAWSSNCPTTSSGVPAM